MFIHFGRIRECAALLVYPWRLTHGSALRRLGKHFGLLKASDMILVDYDGKAIGGNMSRPANAAGFLIHSAVHKARPDVVAAAHTHSPYGKAWSTFCRPLEMLNQDVCYFYGDAQAVYKVRFSAFGHEPFR